MTFILLFLIIPGTGYVFDKNRIHSSNIGYFLNKYFLWHNHAARDTVMCGIVLKKYSIHIYYTEPLCLLHHQC